jgi:hypothetical protein
MTTTTMKNLGMLVPSQNKQPELDRLLARLRNKPFFCGQPITCNGELCFWHNFPVYRHGKQMPCLNYELDILRKFSESLFHIILKPVSAGITTLCLYWLVHKAVVNDDWKNRSVGIIVGPNISLAVKLMKRIRKMFEPYNIFWETKETYSVIGQTEFEVFPSHHLDSYRSLESPVCTYISEAEMFPSHQVSDVREVSERYISKAGGRPYWIIMESTPGSPMGLFDTMFREEPSIYTKTRFDYTTPLVEGMYSQSEIDIGLKSPSANRELLCRFSNLTGSTFRTEDIERAQSFEYNPDLIPAENYRVISCDPSWGSSNFGMVVTEQRDQRIAILFAEEYGHETSENMVDLVYNLYQKYYPIFRINVDSSQISFIKSLKQALMSELKEDPDNERAIKMYKDNKCNWRINMVIQPVYFNEENNKAMLSHVRMCLENGWLMIDKRFTKLLTSLHTCIDQEGRVSKQQMSHSDVFDGLRMCITCYGGFTFKT